MFSSMKKHDDCALLFVRLVVAAIFIYHGFMKWDMETPTMTFTILKYLEPIFGLTVLLGLFTRVSSLVLGIVMIGAIYMKATGFGQGAFDLFGTFASGGKWEFDLAILACCVVLFCMGAGKLSIDKMMSK